MLKPITLTSIAEPARQHTTGSLARLDSAKRRITGQLRAREVEEQPTELLPTVNGRYLSENVTLYKSQDTPALLLIAGAVEDFYRQVGRFPRELTMNPLIIMEAALQTHDWRHYYVCTGATQKAIKLASQPGMDLERVLCHG